MKRKLTHLDARGNARMVDVGSKAKTTRVATAQAILVMRPDTRELAFHGDPKKGDVLATARVAGIMAAKKTSELIPLCHPIALTSVQVDIEPAKDKARVRITARAKTSDRTGVEMEAMTAASVAALTFYDMLKAVDRAMSIEQIALLEKSGGKSGNFKRR